MFLYRRYLRKSPTSRNKKLESNQLKSNNDRMTETFFEINGDFYLLEHLTYNPAIKVIKISTEGVGDWKKVNFKCPEESEHYFFI